MVSLFLFLASMGGFHGEEHESNRVERIIIILFFSALAAINIYALLYCGFNDSWIYLAFLALILLGAGWFAWYCIYGNGWLNQRMNWLGGDFPPSEREGKGDLVIRRSTSIDKNTTCFYMPKQRLFKILRRLYTDPQRHDEECKERISLLRHQLVQTGILMDLVTYTDESPFFFDVEMGIEKSAANKKNVCKIGEILTALSEKDPHVYYRLDTDDEVWLMDVFRNKVVMAKSFVYSSDDDSDNHEVYARHRPQELLDIMLSGEGVEKIKEIQIFTQEEFEAIMQWDEENVEFDE